MKNNLPTAFFCYLFLEWVYKISNVHILKILLSDILYFQGL